MPRPVTRLGVEPRVINQAKLIGMGPKVLRIICVSRAISHIVLVAKRRDAELWYHKCAKDYLPSGLMVEVCLLFV